MNPTDDGSAAADAGAERWRRVRALVAELFELPEAEREERLAGVGPELAAEARALLAAGAGEVSERFERAVSDRAAEALAADASDADPATLAGVELGPWRLTRPLGRGGMAEVWEAARSDGEYEQTVAVKLLKRGMDSQEIVSRFRRERQILARLEHPAIARILDGGVAPDGRPYLVLEKIDGEPINSWCERTGADLERRLRLLMEACEAVAAAHRQLVVHRDLKPSNLLVDGAGRPRLLDFGIAKLLDDDEASAAVTRAEYRMLTPAYAAPEQVTGGAVSTATDVYALGVIAYELVTGELPHRRPRGGVTRLASAVAAETTPRPSQVLAEADASRPDAAELRRRARLVRGDLDTVLLTALHRDPARRYATVGALADDLGRFLAGRPVAARPDRVGYRLRKFVLRHRLATAATVAAAVALVAALGTALVQARRAASQAEAAAAQATRAERVQRFLIEVFRKSEPGEALGETLTARQILAEGVETIDRQLAAEPAVAADLYDALAEIHHRLGLVPQGVELAGRALALRETRLPADPERIGATLVRLAALQIDGAAPAAAVPVAERAWKLLRDAAGPDGLEAARAESQLGSALIFADRPEEGVERHRHAFEVMRLRADRVEAATQAMALARGLEQTGDYEESIATFESALPDLAAGLGELHPEVSYARRDLAGVLDRVGRPAEAERLLVQSLAAQRKVLGERHPQVGETLFSYGILLNTAGRLGEAEAAFREALAIEGAGLHRAHCLRFLGNNLAEQGRLDESVRCLEEAIAEYRRVEGPDSIEGWRAVANLGHAHLRRGNAERAETELRAAVARLEALTGPESYQVRMPLRQLGETLRARGELAESVALLRRTRALEVKLFGTEDHGDIALTDLHLARSLLAGGAPADRREALALLDQSIELFRRHKTRSVGLADALLERGKLRLAGGDAASARADFEESATRLASAFGPSDARVREARRLLDLARG